MPMVVRIETALNPNSTALAMRSWNCLDRIRLWESLPFSNPAEPEATSSLAKLNFDPQP